MEYAATEAEEKAALIHRTRSDVARANHCARCWRRRFAAFGQADSCPRWLFFRSSCTEIWCVTRVASGWLFQWGASIVSVVSMTIAGPCHQNMEHWHAKNESRRLEAQSACGKRPEFYLSPSLSKVGRHLEKLFLSFGSLVPSNSPSCLWPSSNSLKCQCARRGRGQQPGHFPRQFLPRAAGRQRRIPGNEGAGASRPSSPGLIRWNNDRSCILASLE